ncbi:hypothetical protein [Novosphingobium sp. B1]|uniref:hypothetical protein n=1 Tax=Novosphingobium sp. B1 TaxID=1938756 RepID=UPI0009D86F4D|nr:hypothetical protein [Novosphingobium sp. B1]SMD03718.1 hypothetical protein SAMN06272759_1251 [Novosphingobium sp. B1]
MTDIRQALEEAFKVIHPEPPYSWKPLPVGDVITDPAVKAHRYWLYNVQGRFYRFLDAEAWTDAAMMLVPEGWEWAYLDNAAIVREAGTLKHAYGNAPTPAHALLAACLKAKEQADG